MRSRCERPCCRRLGCRSGRSAGHNHCGIFSVSIGLASAYLPNASTFALGAPSLRSMKMKETIFPFATKTSACFV